ncbi:MAG: hypothetical protein WC602_04145 [archaeon]
MAGTDFAGILVYAVFLIIIVAILYFLSKKFIRTVESEGGKEKKKNRKK